MQSVFAVLSVFVVMTITRLTLLLGASIAAAAHPMGNFSVSHYARFDVRPPGVELTYVLDFAEIPTFELTGDWKLQGRDRAAATARANENAREWLTGLKIAVEGRPVPARLEKVRAEMADGAGGMPVLRVTMTARIAPRAGRLEYEDTNYSTRAGWKEIVVTSHDGATLEGSTVSAEDRSHGLTAYPSEATAAPPQNLSASFRWMGAPDPPLPRTASKIVPQPVVKAPEAPAQAAAPRPPFAPENSYAGQQQRKAMGSVVRGDYLSRMLGGREITWGVLLVGLCVAFALGAAHALSPGHGKTIVAAYLVGSRGTMKHALFLGGMVTFTHTVSVFALGLGVLFFQRYVVPEKVIPALGAVSGLSIVLIGGMLLYQRLRRLVEHSHAHADGLAHDHHHHHDHDHHHHHDHDHNPHHHHEHVHTHGGTAHSHVPEGPLSLGSLIALGASGGLVPCPSALVLLLSAIALGRTGIGLMLLASFSAGLALVLMAVGAAVLYAKSLLPRVHVSAPALRYVPVFSAVVVIVLGLLMTGVSIGWIQPGRILG